VTPWWLLLSLFNIVQCFGALVLIPRFFRPGQFRPDGVGAGLGASLALVWQMPANAAIAYALRSEATRRAEMRARAPAMLSTGHTLPRTSLPTPVERAAPVPGWRRR